jgi:hypothetical protein
LQAECLNAIGTPDQVLFKTAFRRVTRLNVRCGGVGGSWNAMRDVTLALALGTPHFAPLVAGAVKLLN